MSPFADTQTRLKPSLLGRLTERRTSLVFLVCLVVGLGVVAWRVNARAETARAIARTEARARGASLELQLSRLASAAEVLGVLAKQGRAGLTNFQRVATELLSAHPGLASLELEPGGVVSDIAPRAGHERTVGFNVLKDAGQRVVANESIARRVPTLAGPVTLDHGEQGIVARLPIFQRTSDGRDSLWGFVAASMRLRDFLGKPQTDDLVRAGYNFALLAPVPGQQKAIAIASHGLSSVQDTVPQSVRAQNLEFSLVLKPPGGWVDKTKMVLESLAVVLICALASLSFNLLESRRAVETDLRETAQRLDREVADRNRAREDIRGTQQRMAATQTELKQIQLAVQQGETKVAQLEQSNRELKARLLAAEEAEARVAELNGLLQKAQEELKQRKEPSSGSAKTASAELDDAGSRGAEIPERPALTLPVVAEASTKVSAETPSAVPSERSVLSQTEQSTSPSSGVRDSQLPSGAVENEPSVTHKVVRPPKHKKARSDNQLHLFGDEGSATPATIRPSADEGDDMHPASGTTVLEQPRHLPPAPPVDPTQLRKAVNLILPLLAERDPGAKECVRDNRKTFRSAFTPEAYVEFEQLVRKGDCEAALEQLKKAARKHGISA